MKQWWCRRISATVADKVNGGRRRIPVRLPSQMIGLATAMPVLCLSIAGSAVAQGQDGRALYVARCASCHGAELQGQPDWRSPDENGLYPAPPHDESGRTSHQDDTMLTNYITRGGQAVLDDTKVPFTSGMPGFGTVLNASEITAILDYIKSTWPERNRLLQAERSQEVSAD